MTWTDVVRWIGASHLLQPPLTAFLAGPRGLDLRARISGRTPLAGAVVHNMGFAAVALPTALGLLVAVHAEHAFEPGAARSVALLTAAFWTWRLYRQIFLLDPAWPARPRLVARTALLLKLIFLAQGPALAFAILFGAR
jgi:hypothetical protein